MSYARKIVLGFTLAVINPLLLVGVAVYDSVRHPKRTWKLIVGPPNIFARAWSYLGRYFYKGRYESGSSFWGPYVIDTAHAGAPA